ncbi:MAG: EAL domain-containing protein [Xanthobacteraceae bacterium]|nr:EAL domain-containing protein [Xanthobacteraceae bacterium]
MIRASTIFVGICMALIAASLGLVLHAVAGIDGPQSALVALVALIFMTLYGAVSMRLAARPKIASQIADLSQGTADLARQVGEFGRRLSAIEGRMTAATSASQDRLNAMHDEISELGGLVSQLAEAVAAHDDQIADGLIAAAMPEAAPPFQAPPPPALARPTARPAIVADARAVVADDDYLDIDAPQPRNDAALIDAVRAAIDANRVDIYLQPIVTLPQRKVRFYEAVTRLRDDGDNVIAAEDFIAPAEAAGLIGRIDHGVILRSVQVLRRLTTRNKDVGVFCNIAPATLADPSSFAQCLDFLDANRANAASFILEFRQSAFERLGAVEREHLAALAQRGYRFSIDHVESLRIEPRELADRGVRFIKVSAALLLDQKHAAAADIHAADLSDLLGRFGIDLIAERIEGERAVVDLLDYNVRFGQGFLFAAPKPLRPETTPVPQGHTHATAAPDPSKQEALVAAQTIEPRRIDPSRGNAALARRAVRPH